MINSLFRRFIKFSIQVFHLYFPEFKVISIIPFQSFIQSLQGFTLCFQLLLPSVWSFLCLPELFMKVLHVGSSRIYIPSQSFHRDSFLRSSSFLHLASGVQFSLPYHWRWCYVILDNLSSCVMIHMLLRMRYSKSINLFVGVILCHVSLKAFPKDCCYLGCL